MSADLLLKMVIILSELMIAQPCSQNERTLVDGVCPLLLPLVFLVVPKFRIYKSKLEKEIQAQKF